MMRFLGCILLILLFGEAHIAYSQESGGSIGMRVGEVTDAISRAFGLTEPHGAIVYSIDETGPARSADIQPGDLIIKLNDRNVREYREFAEFVKKTPAGTHVNLTIVRLGQEQIKTVTIMAPATSIRNPACEEFAWIKYEPMAIQTLFGKLARDMNLADLDEANAIRFHCWQMRLRGVPLGKFAWVQTELENAKRGRLENDRRALARDQAIFQSRLVEERKNTEARAETTARAAEAKARADECRKQCKQKLLAILDKLHSLEPNAASIEMIRELRREHQALIEQMPPDVSAALSALNDSFVAEYKPAEAKALADEYRQKLASMLKELRSLDADQRSVERFRELDRQHEALIQQMPPDVSVALRSLNDTFITEYKNRSVSMSKIEDKLIADANAEKKKKDEEEKKAERIEQLQQLYIPYMIIQVCAERFSAFKNTKSGLRDVLKTKEAGLSSEQVRGVWNAMAEQFKKVEAMMKMYGDAQLYTECDQTSRYVASLMMVVPETGGTTQGLPLRKKDF